MSVETLPKNEKETAEQAYFTNPALQRIYEESQKLQTDSPSPLNLVGPLSLTRNQKSTGTLLKHRSASAKLLKVKRQKRVCAVKFFCHADVQLKAQMSPDDKFLIRQSDVMRFTEWLKKSEYSKCRAVMNLARDGPPDELRKVCAKCFCVVSCWL